VTDLRKKTWFAVAGEVSNLLGAVAIVGMSSAIFVDALKIKSISRRDFLKRLGIKLPLLALATQISPEFSCLIFAVPLTGKGRVGKAREFLRKIDSKRTYLLPHPLVELRNAVVAKKLDESIAPMLKKELERNGVKRKPVIWCVWGAGHTGFIECLKSRKRRERVLRLYKGKIKWFYDPKTIDSSIRWTYNKETGEWKMRRYKTPVRKTAKIKSKKLSRRKFFRKFLPA
jgi:hypothetical protein